VDARHSVRIRIACDDHDRGLAYLAKPPRDFYAFATAFEIYVHQDDIGLIAHRQHSGLLAIGREIANIEPQSVHVSFEVDGKEDLIIHDQGATVPWK
jgi:hypothetical protein